MARVALTLSLLVAATAAPRVCLAPPADSICLTWTVDASNITFTGTWPANPGAVGWGAWGISAVSCGSMFPSSVWMAISGPGGVVLEDRAATAHTVPQCQKQQLSHVTASSVEPDGSFTVTWTRPLIAPPSSKQPSITAGNVSLIGAAYAGAPLDLRPCEPTGVPLHTNLGTFTVQLLATADAARDALAQVAAAAPSGLVAAVPVCGGTHSNFARVSPRGAETFYGVAEAPAYLAVTAVDAAGRRLYGLTEDPTGTSLVLVSVDIDTGRLMSSCNAGVLVPASGGVQNVGLAWDARNSSLIVAACTDSICAGYVQVSRLNPGTCARAPVVKIPTDPAATVFPGAAAFDAAANIFVTSLTQTIRGATGLVLVAVDMGTGSVRIFNEASRGIDVVTLAAEAGGAPGAFVGLEVGTYPSAPDVSFVRYDAVGNKLARAPALRGINGAQPGSGALDAELGVLYFLAVDSTSGGALVIGVHTGNGTIASTGALPGDAGQAPAALFFVR